MVHLIQILRPKQRTKRVIIMRAEVEHLVTDIEKAIDLIRRHL